MILQKFRNRKLYANKAVLARINGKPIRYVSARDENNVESILGRGGLLQVKNDRITLNCEGKTVFACPAKGAVIAELISLGGVRITGLVDGEEQTVTAFFTYFN